MVDNNVVTSRVDYLIVVEEEDVVGHICFKSRNKLCGECDRCGVHLLLLASSLRSHTLTS